MRMHTVQSVGVLSVAKIMGAIYGVLGLLVIPIFLLVGLAGTMIPNQNANNPLGLAGGLRRGLLAPFFYAAMGFVFGALSAFLYNVMAKWIGGIEVRAQPTGIQSTVG
jgi:hypothetical protein